MVRIVSEWMGIGEGVLGMDEEDRLRMNGEDCLRMDGDWGGRSWYG